MRGGWQPSRCPLSGPGRHVRGAQLCFPGTSGHSARVTCLLEPSDSPPALQVAAAEALQADHAVALPPVGRALPEAPPGGLQEDGSLLALERPAHTVGTPTGLDGDGRSPKLQEVATLERHAEPALQEQDPAYHLAVQGLLQGLALSLLQEDLPGGRGGLGSAEMPPRHPHTPAEPRKSGPVPTFGCGAHMAPSLCHPHSSSRPSCTSWCRWSRGVYAAAG